MAEKKEENLAKIEAKFGDPQQPGEISDGTVGDLDEAQRRVQMRPPHGQTPGIDPNPPDYSKASPEDRVRNGLPRYVTEAEKSKK